MVRDAEINQTSQWRHNEQDGVSDHQPHDYFLSRLFRRRSKKTSKLRLTGLWTGNSLVTGEFLAQMASNAENAPVDDVIMMSGLVTRNSFKLQIKKQ